MAIISEMFRGRREPVVRETSVDQVRPASGRGMTPQVLPERVRFGLQHGEAMLTSREIRSLFGANFGDLGFYLTMKASEGHDSLQKGLLTKVAQHDFDPSRMTVEDASEALDAMRAREEVAARSTSNAIEARRASGVQGGKLGEVSRHNFRDWSETFDPVLTTVFERDPETELFVMANAPYIGLDVLARHTIRRGRPLSVLRPNDFDQPDRPVGWRIEPNGGKVTIVELPNDFQRPENGVVFDDTTRSGKNRNTVSRYWSRGGNKPPEYTAAHIIKPQIAV